MSKTSSIGETITETQADDLKAISQKLEVINLQLAQRASGRRKILSRQIGKDCT